MISDWIGIGKASIGQSTYLGIDVRVAEEEGRVLLLLPAARLGLGGGRLRPRLLCHDSLGLRGLLLLGRLLRLDPLELPAVALLVRLGELELGVGGRGPWVD